MAKPRYETLDWAKKLIELADASEAYLDREVPFTPSGVRENNRRAAYLEFKIKEVRGMIAREALWSVTGESID